MPFHFQNCHELEKMDLEECVQVKTAGFPQLSSEGQESSANACSCIRSQMERSYSCPSTALVYKSWWVCARPLNTVSSCLMSTCSWLMELQLCPCRACLTASWSLMMASDILAAAPVPMITLRWSSWTTVPWSQMLPWSTWRAAIAWIALSSTTASRLLVPASRD